MNLKTTSWHVHVYLLATNTFEAWKGEKSPEVSLPIETNLCPYMRRIVMTFPLLILFYTSILCFFLYTIVVYPLTHFGWKYYAYIAAALLVLLVSIAIMYCVTMVFPSITALFNEYVFNPLFDGLEHLSEATSNCIMGKPESPTFCAIWRQWIVDRHEQICRPITIGE